MDRPEPDIPCTKECCELRDNIIAHDDGRRYTCIRHGVCHTCDGPDRDGDPHPVIFSPPNESLLVCGFSGIVVGNIYSQHDCSDEACSAKVVDDDAMGMRGMTFEHGDCAVAGGSVKCVTLSFKF